MSNSISFVAKIQPGTIEAQELFDPQKWYILVYDNGMFNVFDLVEDVEEVITTKRGETALSSLDLFGNSA